MTETQCDVSQSPDTEQEVREQPLICPLIWHVHIFIFTLFRLHSEIDWTFWTQWGHYILSPIRFLTHSPTAGCVCECVRERGSSFPAADGSRYWWWWWSAAALSAAAPIVGDKWTDWNDWEDSEEEQSNGLSCLSLCCCSHKHIIIVYYYYNCGLLLLLQTSLSAAATILFIQDADSPTHGSDAERSTFNHLCICGTETHF